MGRVSVFIFVAAKLKQWDSFFAFYYVGICILIGLWSNETDIRESVAACPVNGAEGCRYYPFVVRSDSCLDDLCLCWCRNQNRELNETSMTKQNSLGNSWQFNIQATEKFLHSNILWIPPLCITSLCNPSIFVLTAHFMKFHQRERYNSLEFPSFAHNLSRDFLKF